MAALPATIYEKFCNGDAISDAELEIGIDHFSHMAELLMKSGPVFKLPAKEAMMVADRLQQYRDARGRR